MGGVVFSLGRLFSDGDFGEGLYFCLAGVSSVDWLGWLAGLYVSAPNWAASSVKM